MGEKIFKIRRGLDLPVAGSAEPVVEPFAAARYCIRPSDFRWMKVQLVAHEGDVLQVGAPLFADKRDARIRICSPVAGTLRQIVRGEKRCIRALVIEPDEMQRTSRDVEIPFRLQDANAQQVREILLQYGLWPALRQRPFSIIANPDDMPRAIFVSCFDSAPLAPDFRMLLQDCEPEWLEGIRVLQSSCPGIPIHLGLRSGSDNSLFEATEGVRFHYFHGPHPAGNVGTQIDFIAPMEKGDVVWYIHPQHVVWMGRLFLHHLLSSERRVAITGPAESHPRYVSTTFGADLDSLLAPDPQGRAVRNIGGNLLTGILLDEFPAAGFYDTQITRILEGGQREFLGWLLPGLKKWSRSHTYTAWMSRRHFPFTTSMQGGERALVMSDVYDDVFPMDFLPAELLKACIAKDVEKMEELGVYSVDSEDFALCEVVCPSKMPWQQIIEEALYYIRDNK